MSATDRPGNGAELSPLKRALVAVERLQQRVRELESARDGTVAIVGAACRFPGGAHDLESFARLLRDGRDAIVDRPPVPRPGWDRWEHELGPFPPAGWLDLDVTAFDPAFFGISHREAASIDPQQRLALECAWEALEHAGINPRGLEGSLAGVFVGATADDYAQVQLRSGPLPEVLHSHYASGVAKSMVAGRISYLLGLQGPSLVLDTACSSSLVAVHLACQSLREGESDLALAGGVSLILSPEATLAFQQARMLAPDGRCKTFDAAADGFTRGEGCGFLVLKRAAAARRDGDRILALIRGSAVNQDGASTGLTAPNGGAQEIVIRAALAQAGLCGSDIDFVEAHGTGTSLGDPIEVQALAAALGPGRTGERPLLIGSVKTNVGHLEAAAGVAGVLRAVIALRDRSLPPHLHLAQPNPHVAWDWLPVELPAGRRPFGRDGVPGRGGVSSFGFSGTNAHVILEEAPPAAQVPGSPADRGVHVLPLSAQSPAALEELVREYAELLARPDAPSLAEVAHTAGAGRAAQGERAAIVARDARSAAQALRSGAAVRGRAPVDEPRVALLFPGQGVQYAGMTRALYAAEPVFRAFLDRCDALLAEPLGRSLVELLHEEGESDLARNRTAVTQPAVFAVGLGIAELWQSWGVRPVAVLGHSVGEYAAAVFAGALPLEDGLRLITDRARRMEALPGGGAMAAIFCDEATALEAIAPLDGAVSLAAVNGPTSVVVSGDAPLVTELLESFRARGIDGRMLRVSHAFHSRRIEPMLPALRDAVSSLRFVEPEIRVVSNLYGKPVPKGDHADPEYWVRHSREAVRFGDGIRWLHDAGVRVFLECGPDATLGGMGARCLPDAEAHWVASLRPGRDDGASIAAACAALHTAGVDLDWRGRDRPWPRRRVDVPTTPFQRVRCWVPDRGGAESTGVSRSAEPHPLLGQRVRIPHDGWLFERTLRAATLPFLADHVVRGSVIVPAAAWLEAALAAAAAGPGWDMAALEDVAFMDALELDADAARALQITVEPPAGGRARFRIHSIGDGEPSFRLHAEGTLVEEVAGAIPALDPTAAARCTETIDPDGLYEELRARGLEFGSAFRGMTAVRRGGDDALGSIVPPEDDARYRIHPALLDAGIQVVAAAARESAGRGALFMPIAVGRYRVVPGAVPVTSHARLLAVGTDLLEASVRLHDGDGCAVAVLEGLRFRRVPDAALPSGPADPAAWVHALRWEPSPNLVAQPPLLPAPGALARELTGALGGVAGEEGTQTYAELLPDLDRLATAWIAHTLRLLGWTPAAGMPVDAAALAAELGVRPAHHRLLRRFLEFLAQDGVLTPAREGGHWTVARIPSHEDPDAIGRELAARHAPHDAELTVVARTGAGLAAALAGETDPLELLFPGGDTAAQARIYRDTPVARTFNTLIARAAAEAARTATGMRPLRILEIGGGTGGTTEHVLPVLAGESVGYTFTDVGPLFVARARDRFAAHRFVRFATLDIEKDPGHQGFEPGAFDLVLATNVVHATRDVPATLARIRELLAPGGMVCLAEVTSEQRWLDLTVGLTPGWWAFQDALRTRSPLLGRDAWLSALESAGFDAPHAVTSDDDVLSRQAVFLGAKPRAGRWLVLADGGGEGVAFADRLAAEGIPVIVVPPAGGRAPADADRAAFDALVRSLDPPPHDVASFRALDADWHTGAGEAPLTGALERACASTLHLAQALVGAGGPVPRLHLVTRAAQQVASPLERVAPAQAAAWGMARSIAIEHPELRMRRIDIGGDDDAAMQALHRELLSPDEEPEVALRGEQRLVPRLAAAPEVLALEHGPAGRLQRGGQGGLDALTFQPIEDRPPGPDEVEITVQAAGLNFRDVVHALGLRSDVDVLGTECVGRVLRAGARVEHVAPGDLVAAAGGAIGERVTLHAGLVVRVPDSLTVAAAATLPIAFLTADLALREVGRMRTGESILVHAAAGGVGMAAVQLAVAAGLEVYGTAGSAEKRARVLALGARDVFDSRSTAFAGLLLEATGGQGVDLVLNSLTGEMIPASLRVLARRGRFLEIGKAEVWSRARVAELPGVQPGIVYRAVDLSDDLQLGPALVRPRLEAIVARVAAGELRPLPARTYPMSRATDAFREMAAARHAGKLVLLPDGASPVRPDGSYLVTGGLSGLGLAVAARLAERGAGSLVLMGRGAPTDEASAEIERIRAQGTTVRVARGDVADAAALARTLDGIGRELPPLRGIVHCAGVLHDAALIQQRWEEVLEVLRPKALGIATVERVTRDAPLDFFVLFSSAAAVIGSAGQANHAAANAFLDGLACDRVAVGLPGISVAWGAWSGIGAAVRHGVDGVALDPATGLRIFERLLRGAPPSVLAAAPHLRAASAARTRVRPDPERYASASDGPRITERLERLRGEARAEAIRDWIEQCAAGILQLPPGSAIEPRRPLGEIGLDSLLAVELRNVLGAGLGRTLPATLLFDYPTVESLAVHLDPQLDGDEAVAPGAAPPAGATDLLERIESLSEDEVQDLLRGASEP